jgi:ribosomal protein S18 acetylase RimI-like enzyme
VVIRRALLDDGERLAEIDRLTWSLSVTPQLSDLAGRQFFDGDLDPSDVLVAEVDGVLVGYVQLGYPTKLAANQHVLAVRGLAVLPAYRRRGIARRLLSAAIEEARERGACRLTLRVLGTNGGAQALYASMGFEVEGILHGEFLIEGRYVDDVLMAIPV